MKTYQLTVTESQAKMIQDGLELLSRLKMGQIHAVLYHLPQHDDCCPHELQHALEYAYRPFKPNEFADTWNEWDLYTLIRHRLSWDNKPDNMANPEMFRNYDEPTHYGTEPLAKIVRVDDE